jgi:hypothetical protein
MEDVIRTHLNAIFFGSLPTTAVKIHQRYSLRNGLPLTHFGSDNHSKKPDKYLVGAEGTPPKDGAKQAQAKLSLIETCDTCAQQHVQEGPDFAGDHVRA